MQISTHKYKKHKNEKNRGVLDMVPQDGRPISCYRPTCLFSIIIIITTKKVRKQQYLWNHNFKLVFNTDVAKNQILNSIYAVLISMLITWRDVIFLCLRCWKTMLISCEYMQIGHNVTINIFILWVECYVPSWAVPHLNIFNKIVYGRGGFMLTKIMIISTYVASC
jgi:hypothetical protein